MIPFNRPPHTGFEDKYVAEAMGSSKLSGDGYFSNLCERWLETTMSARRALLTPSCTQALEMAAILIDIKPGDEVIMPSYTFVSTANAFVLRGATIVFVDVEPTTMNINADLIEDAITPRTRAIVPVHYAGVACDMRAIMKIADRHNLWVIEDAAQALGARYRGEWLGAIGHLGTFSFHETKNYTSGGEGGAIVINDPDLIDRAEVIREKGTNRKTFLDGLVDKYTWVDLGSSFLPSELQAAYLWGQLEAFSLIAQDRRQTWDFYQRTFAEDEPFEHSASQASEEHNSHLFFVKMKDVESRGALIKHLANEGVMGVFHYVPLHSAPAGAKFGRFHGQDVHTTRESSRLVRLPLWYGMTDEIRTRVTEAVLSFKF